MSIIPAKAILVDARNIDQLLPELKKYASVENSLVGYDIETSSREAHGGIKELLKMGDDFHTKGNKVLFDFNRTVVTGCSFYFGMIQPNTSYYFNFKHADVENRINISIMFELLDLIKASNSKVIIHNRQFEYCVLKGSYGYTLPEGYCSMQFCVTAYNPDTYPKNKLPNAVTKALTSHIAEIETAFHTVDKKLTFRQEELIRKFCSKSKGSEFSYEGGIVPSIAYGYGLKQAVKSWFGYQMEEYKDTLNGEPDMEALTGDQVASYGCDDAFWCYHLFLHIYSWLEEKNPKVIDTFMEVENPIVDIFAETTLGGMSVNLEEINRIGDVKRHEFALELIKFKNNLREIVPDDLPEFNQKLAKYDKWYTTASHAKYFRLIKNWLATDDEGEDFDICTQVKCATGNAWFSEVFGKELKNPNLISINHYMAMRYILFVICGFDITISKGKVQSDGDAREKMGDHPILNNYKTIGDIEQGMKLYNTPYKYLTDPETERMYPQMTSLLATRRTSCSNPNAQQLSKRGASVYVRGYFQADEEDHLIVSADWSAVELVRIGAASKDPEFLKAYGQRPHDDLHSAAAAGVLKMELNKFYLLPDKKDKRTILGKGSNFEYWYSGMLMQTADRMGWTMDEMWEATEGYRNKFPVGEQWRLDLIRKVKKDGFVQLPDHHIRYRYEATDDWAFTMMNVFNSFGSQALINFGRIVIRKIQNRAGNQAVNADVQGTCGALAKRTIIKTIKCAKERKFKSRFMLLIHDELLFSVHKSQVLDFSKFLYEQMVEDSDLFPDVKLDSSIAVGYNFRPFSLEGSGVYGQIELSEINKDVPCVVEDSYGKAATDTEKEAIIHYLSKRSAT